MKRCSRLRVRAACWGLGGALSILAGAARAAPDAEDPRSAASQPASAEILFTAGREAMGRGDLERACALFAESYRLDAAVGTLFNLATCEEGRGRVASAWEHLRAGIAQLREGDPRARAAEAQAAKVQARLPWLTLGLPPDAPSGTRVFRDGVELTSVSLGTALPLDPGPHVVRVVAPERAPREVRLTLREAERRAVVLPLGEPIAPATRTSLERVGSRAPASSPLRPWAWGVGSVGAAAALVGIGAGTLAFASSMDVRRECDATGLCTPAGLDAHARTRDFATVSTVTLASGAVLLAVSTVLFLVSPPRTPSKVRGAASLGVWEF